MRIRGRTDGNQKAIVRKLRQLGISVHSTANLGKGFPDLAVGYGGRTYLLELKDGSRYPSDRKLTDAEQKWHSQWKGHVATVCSLDDILREIGAKK